MTESYGKQLVVEPFCLGDFMTNCYVLHVDRPSGSAKFSGGGGGGGGRGIATPRSCWIVDAGFDPEPMVQYARSHGLQPQKIVLTHAHVDHIAGLADLRAVWPDVPILIHPNEKAFLTDPALNLSAFLEEPVIAPPADGELKHGQHLDLDGLDFEVRHTPGHSPGGIALYQPESHVVLVGDTLFADSIGRYDFPTSDYASLMRSIHTQLFTLPDDTRVYPGHGPPTTIGQERRHNALARGEL